MSLEKVILDASVSEAMLPEGYVMMNRKTMPEIHRSRYNHATLCIIECEEQGFDTKAEHWRDHRHQIMTWAMEDAVC